MSAAAELHPQRIDFVSSADGASDWYLRHAAGPERDCVVVLHGHGAHGDQLFSRADQAAQVEFLSELGCNVISPNLRDNAWMNPRAAADLAEILCTEKTRMRYRRCILAGGSMGGTGALIFAVRHPELVDGLAVMGAATSIRRYRNWCAEGELPIHRAIMAAIDAGYDAESLDRHDVCKAAERLTMPLRFYHSVADRVIPVLEMRELRRQLAGCATARFTELPPLAEAPHWWSDHDTPLQYLSAAVGGLLDPKR